MIPYSPNILKMHTLLINILEDCPNYEQVKEYYEKMSQSADGHAYKGDSGIDLIFPKNIDLPAGSVTKCHLGIRCEFLHNGDQNASFDMLPRSSICNTPLMLDNSIGLIDSEYRGEIIAAFRCFYDCNHPSTLNDHVYSVQQGQRLVQLVSPDRRPIKVILTDKLSEGSRGGNGFGSSG